MCMNALSLSLLGGSVSGRSRSFTTCIDHLDNQEIYDKYTTTYLHDGKDSLGEGPVWHPAEQKFYWTDIWGSKLWSLELPADGSNPTDQNITEFKLENRVSGMAPWEDGGFVCSFVHKGFGTLKIADGKVEETILGVAPNITESNGIVFNDAKCSPDGRFFAGQLDDKAERGEGFKELL